jgi:hypothetical protein
VIAPVREKLRPALEWWKQTLVRYAAIGELDPEQPQKEIEAYRQELHELSGRNVSSERGITKSELGIRLVRLGEKQNNLHMIEEGLEVLEQALSGLSDRDSRLDWALVHNNIGSAWLKLWEHKDTEDWESLKKGAKAHRNALSVLTRGKAPEDWAIAKISKARAVDSANTWGRRLTAGIA